MQSSSLYNSSKLFSDGKKEILVSDPSFKGKQSVTCHHCDSRHPANCKGHAAIKLSLSGGQKGTRNRASKNKNSGIVPPQEHCFLQARPSSPVLTFLLGAVVGRHNNSERWSGKQVAKHGRYLALTRGLRSPASSKTFSPFKTAKQIKPTFTQCSFPLLLALSGCSLLKELTACGFLPL